MSEQLNPRTKRVREALMRAAFSLVAERPVVEISLTEVAEVAQVSRPTVYKQFNDTASLVAATTIEFMESTFSFIDVELEDADKETTEYLERLMLLFVQAVYDHRCFCRNAMYGPSCIDIVRYVVRMLDKRMADGLVGRRLLAAGSLADDCRASIAAGAVWLLVKWLGSDFQGENEPDRIAKRIAAVMFDFSGVEAE